MCDLLFDMLYALYNFQGSTKYNKIEINKGSNSGTNNLIYT